MMKSRFDANRQVLIRIKPSASDQEAVRQSPPTTSFDPAHPHLCEEVKFIVLAKYSLTLRYSVDIYGGLVSPLVSLVTSYAKLDKT